MNLDNHDVRISVGDTLVEAVALSVVKTFKEDIFERIDLVIQKEIGLKLVNIMQTVNEVKTDIKNEIMLYIKAQTGFKAISQMKSEVKSALRKEHSEFIKGIAKDKIASLMFQDIKVAVKKHYSAELVEEFKSEITFQCLNEIKKQLKEITPEITVCAIHKSPTPSINKPAELRLMKDVFEIDVNIAGMPFPSGVYFLYKNNILQYIGQAVYINRRIDTHINDLGKDFDAVYFIPVAISELDWVESYLIHQLNPPLNRAKGQLQYRNVKPEGIYELMEAV